jgi:hypothetical protein
MAGDFAAPPGWERAKKAQHRLLTAATFCLPEPTALAAARKILI